MAKRTKGDKFYFLPGVSIPRVKLKDVSATIGGKYTWSFTQTGLGCVIVLNCVCEEAINLTDFETW